MSLDANILIYWIGKIVWTLYLLGQGLRYVKMLSAALIYDARKSILHENMFTGDSSHENI